MTIASQSIRSKMPALRTSRSLSQNRSTRRSVKTWLLDACLRLLLQSMTLAWLSTISMKLCSSVISQRLQWWSEWSTICSKTRTLDSTTLCLTTWPLTELPLNPLSSKESQERCTKTCSRLTQLPEASVSRPTLATCKLWSTATLHSLAKGSTSSPLQETTRVSSKSESLREMKPRPQTTSTLASLHSKTFPFNQQAVSKLRWPLILQQTGTWLWLWQSCPQRDISRQESLLIGSQKSTMTTSKTRRERPLSCKRVLRMSPWLTKRSWWCRTLSGFGAMVTHEALLRGRSLTAFNIHKLSIYKINK